MDSVASLAREGAVQVLHEGRFDFTPPRPDISAPTSAITDDHLEVRSTTTGGILHGLLELVALRQTAGPPWSETARLQQRLKQADPTCNVPVGGLGADIASQAKSRPRLRMIWQEAEPAKRLPQAIQTIVGCCDLKILWKNTCKLERAQVLRMREHFVFDEVYQQFG